MASGIEEIGRGRRMSDAVVGGVDGWTSWIISFLTLGLNVC